MIRRQLFLPLTDRLFTGKAIILTGPRQVGKTTLIREMIAKEDFLFLDGDDITVRNMLSDINTEKLKLLIRDKKIVFIDESQRIENIGLTAKIIVDQIKATQLILSGSSSFDINEKISESLTGRKWTFNLWPISCAEWMTHVGYLAAEQSLDNRLIFGFYPDILNYPEDQETIISELVSSYLFKDVLTYDKIRKSDTVFKLVQALAYQVGSEVNYSELSKLIGLDAKTVAHYIDILEKAFVVFSLKSFSNNHRNEIKKGMKIYFFDNGIRNAIIGNFNDLKNRTDVGALWENFLISERYKQISYSKKIIRAYFWRNTQQQEIDYIEQRADKISAYEFKWNPDKKVKFPITFTKLYKAETQVISRNNFSDFVSPIVD
jgi:predicted AAA+ superfamily ATPase